MSRRARPSLESLEGKALLSVPGLVTTLTTDRSTYEVGQPVRMTFRATNEGTQPVNFTVDDQWTDFTVSSGGKTRWDEDYGQVTLPLATMRTLAPGQSYTLTATWNGSPDEGGPVASTGTLQVQCGLDPSLSTAITVEPGPPPPSYATPVPISPLQGGPSGVNPSADTEVSDLYEMILGRAPDETGRANAVSAVQGGMPLGTVASGLLHSAEYEYKTVASDYLNYLGRAATPDEIELWVSLMQAGLTPEQVARDFLASSSFSALHPGEGDFLQAIYQDVLGRQASASEVSAWEATGASRTTIVADALSSTEAETKAVEGLYTNILGRPADPGGLSVDVSALQSGKMTLDDLTAAFLGSAEFKARADRSSV